MCSSDLYKFVEWDEGQSITMEKFDDYYDGAAKIDKIIFKIVDDDSSRALQLKFRRSRYSAGRSYIGEKLQKERRIYSL